MCRLDTPWLHGMLMRDDVTRIMRENGMTEGLFLVRESGKRIGDYVLSVYNFNKVQHYIITVRCSSVCPEAVSGRGMGDTQDAMFGGITGLTIKHINTEQLWNFLNRRWAEV